MNGKRPTVASVHGMVAAAHPLAAAAGARILAEGGNAFDAAVAAAAALNVVEPNMSGLAGSGMATCWIAGERQVRSLAFRAPIPSQIPMGRFHHREELHRGAMAAMAPGSLAGWFALHAHGRRPIADCFAPAIGLAEGGFPMLEFNASQINAASGQLRGEPAYSEWNRVYMDGRGAVAVGDILRQPDLARTYRAIAADGLDHLYGGALGRAMVAHIQALGGCLTEADLTAPIVRWLDPISARYRDLLVHTPPPSSQSFQFLLALRILDGFDVSALERNGLAHLDLAWRAVRLSAGARIAHDNPDPERLAWLLSDQHVAELRIRAGDGMPIYGPTEQWTAPAAAPTKVHQQHTTSFSIVDAEGNMICLTQSLGAGFGCGVVIPGTGVCMNNALYWGELDQRSPNALRPGGMLMSAMAPSISLRRGRPVLALGTPGSYGICQTQPQAMMQHVDFGLGIQDAIDAPRARLLDGRRVQAESRFSEATLVALRNRGHDVEAAASFTMAVGGMQAIAYDPDSGVMTGAADPRRDGYVATA